MINMFRYIERKKKMLADSRCINKRKNKDIKGPVGRYQRNREYKYVIIKKNTKIVARSRGHYG